jgi:hypothetical protein
MQECAVSRALLQLAASANAPIRIRHVQSERSGDRAALPQEAPHQLTILFFFHFDYILIGLIAGDKDG